MKNRNIPFGYQYQKGGVMLHPTESAVLKQIIQSYLDGRSLLNIAEELNADQIEYLPGIIGWNKARIMHLLEDKRYLGESGYPAIMDADTYSAIQSKKHKRNNLKNTDRQSDIFQMNVPVLCPDCGMEMYRRHDSRCKCPERWTCRNKDCKVLIELSDNDLLSQITEILNQLIQRPEQINNHEPKAIEQTTEQRKLENEIGRMMDAGTQDKKAIQRKLLEVASLKYKSIPADIGIHYRLRANFEIASPLSEFSAELFGITVKAIHMNKDNAIELELLNGQRFGKE